MADFGELCPIFNAGVYSEVMFPHIGMSGITASGNALVGSLASSITMPGAFVFGRTVVVTDAFVRRYSLNEASMVLYLRHHTSQTAEGTIFGTMTITPTMSIWDAYTWVPFANVTSITFTATDILGIAPSLGTATSAGGYDFIIRYRDK
jgi:hypothetical protein